MGVVASDERDEVGPDLGLGRDGIRETASHMPISGLQQTLVGQCDFRSREVDRKTQASKGMLPDTKTPDRQLTSNEVTHLNGKIGSRRTYIEVLLRDGEQDLPVDITVRHEGRQPARDVR